MRDTDSISALLAERSSQDYCYLTTRGRVSGRPHEIEIWFGAQRNIIYLLSGSGKSDWVKNLRKDSSASVRIAEHVFTGLARFVTDKEEEQASRYLLAEKYQEWEEGKTLSEWARTALPVAIDLLSMRTTA